MGLFTPGRHSAFQKKQGWPTQTQPAEEHPAFGLGQQAGQWVKARFEQAGRFLNAWQHRAGFRRRNYVILGVLLSLLVYFLYDLLTVF